MIERLRELWNRPLEGRARPALFAASVGLLLICAAIALTVARGDGDRADTERGRRPPAAPDQPAAPDGEQLPAAGAQPSPSLRTADVGAARRAGRSFLQAYLGYSYGRGDVGRLPAATAELRAELAKAPPRVPARVRAARPRLLSTSSELHGDGLETVALIDDGQRSYSISLFLERDRRHGWQVAAVGG